MVVCYIKTSHDTGELPRSIVDVIFTLKRLGYFNPLKSWRGGGGAKRGPKDLGNQNSDRLQIWHGDRCPRDLQYCRDK